MNRQNCNKVSKTIASTLAEIDADPTLTWSLRKVMRLLFHVSESTVSRWLSGRQQMEMEQIRALACHLCDEYDERRLSNCFHGQRYRLVPRPEAFTNGLISDDVTRLIEAVGDVVRNYDAKEKELARAAHIRASSHFSNLGEEIERL